MSQTSAALYSFGAMGTQYSNTLRGSSGEKPGPRRPAHGARSPPRSLAGLNERGSRRGSSRPQPTVRTASGTAAIRTAALGSGALRRALRRAFGRLAGGALATCPHLNPDGRAEEPELFPDPVLEIPRVREVKRRRHVGEEDERGRRHGGLRRVQDSHVAAAGALRRMLPADLLHQLVERRRLDPLPPRRGYLVDGFEQAWRALA